MRKVANGMGFVLLAAALTAGWLSAQEAPHRTPPTPRPALGMNLNGPADWNTELPFVDVFRLSRAWISQREGADWGKGPPLELDRHGWIKRLEPGCWADTPLCTIHGGHYPAGRYTVLYDGQGRLVFWGAAAAVEETPGRIAIDVDPQKGGFFLRVRETDPDDYVRNIRVVMPGFEETYREQPFHPAFLRRWHGVACFRFMDWMKTNGSTIAAWSDRPVPEDATFTTRGVPLEVMIDLCNRQGADAWFCMPHLCDDDCVRGFAQMAKNRLDPALKVYVEYSNETWNGMFAQTDYAREQGTKLGLGERPWEAGWRYTAHRSVQIFRVWQDVFGGTERLVRVLPTQAANSYISERIAEFEDAYREADALAVAPYIGFSVPASGDGLTAGVVSGWTVEQVLDHMETKALPQSVEWVRRQKEVADRFGLRLVAYEGGQHMVGVHGGENNERMRALFQAANAHPRLGVIYRRYLDAWQEAGGDLFCYFSSVGRWSKWGSWGIMQHYDEAPADAPKFMATMSWAASLGQPVSLPE